MKCDFKTKASHLLTDIHPDILVFTTNNLLQMTFLKSIDHEIPIVVESHMARTIINKTKRSFLSSIYYAYLKYEQEHSIKNTSAFICLTVADMLLWKNIKDAVVIPNMINRPNLKKNISCTYNRIICVGRISREKGYDLLIDAWSKISSKYSNWEIDIYGNGDMETDLLNQIRTYNITNVNLKGISNNINDEYQKSDFLVLPSRFEGFGLVLAEAMACGIPCVAFNCPCGPHDIIHDKEDGLLVENGNIVRLTEAISWMIEHDEERQKMGENAKKI